MAHCSIDIVERVARVTRRVSARDVCVLRMAAAWKADTQEHPTPLTTWSPPHPGRLILVIMSTAGVAPGLPFAKHTTTKPAL